MVYLFFDKHAALFAVFFCVTYVVGCLNTLRMCYDLDTIGMDSVACLYYCNISTYCVYLHRRQSCSMINASRN